MANALNIRDIGAERKRAIAEEARIRGVSSADLVREWIDAGLDTACRLREAEAWRQAARPGLEAEARFLEDHGPTLARYRPGARPSE